MALPDYAWSLFPILQRLSSLELIWAVIYVANVAAFVMSDRFDWASILAMQTPVTLTVIAMEIRSPRYHGVFCATRIQSERAIMFEQSTIEQNDECP